ncbi:hypothetical protein [Ichthyenterobacterium magnum]|uniref:Uncharacterized protein n=1 Tax=Ichthyenterobacterium magnum TaxID=1230530 RepID=A0A420DEN3_9FLAO|nr:hypothetical protein [Ichthyenterobacterium magnum]RKE90811.1 hypothetical protein BXY80_2654 [Ichthyenterobacterium magnum]
MQKLLTILAFYRPFVIWSFVINALIGFFNPEIIPAIITKLFLAVFVWYLVTETNEKKRFSFYKKLGINTFTLFAVIFIIDIVLTISFLIVFKEFK